MDSRIKQCSARRAKELRSMPAEALLTFKGTNRLKKAAEQAATIIAETFLSPPVSNARNAGEILIHIVINDKGSIDVTLQGDNDFNGQRRGLGMLIGTLMGIGLAKRKRVTVDHENAILDPDSTTLREEYGEDVARRGIGLRFDSFADFAECVNVLAKSQDERIDIVALSKER